MQKLVISLVTLISCFFSVSADPAFPIHEPGRCLMRGQQVTPLFFNDIAPAVAGNDTLLMGIDKLCGPAAAELLPQGPHANASLCCDLNQFQSLQMKLKTAHQVLSSCSACWKNFAAFWCLFTCSRDQSTFIDTPDVSPDTKPGSPISGVDVFVTQEFADSFYDSCKEVKLSAANSLAMNFMAAGAKDGMSMLRALGIKVGLNPIEIRFPDPKNQTHSNITQFEMKVYPCNSSDENFRCSCIDCVETCPSDFPSIPASGICYVGNTNTRCVALTFIILYVVAVLLIIAFFATRVAIKHYRIRHATLNTRLMDEANNSDESEDTMLLPGSQQSEHGTKTFYPWPVDSLLQRYFYWHGLLCARHPSVVVSIATLLVLLLSLGWSSFSVETNPVNLWVDPQSDILAQKTFFDEKFSPFYRITQFIISPKNSSQSILDPEFLSQAWHFQETIENLNVFRGAEKLSLKDFCFKPTSNDCAIQSWTGWYQGKYLSFNEDIKKNLTRMKRCIISPGQFECLSSSLQPLDANLVLGGVPRVTNSAGEIETVWLNATKLVVTLVLDNTVSNTSYIDQVVAWERHIVNFMQENKDTLKTIAYPLLDIVFSTESSIEDELSRETTTDIPTIIISYIAMFFYASIALGNYQRVFKSGTPLQQRIQRLFIDSRFTLGVLGIVIVLASVSTAVGLLSMLGFKSTLIIAEVIPFLVLAVGVDNIFILVNTFDRVSDQLKRGTLVSTHASVENHLPKRRYSEDGESMAELAYPTETRIAMALSHVGPSILLSSLSECIAFGLGYFVTMPAVSIFSLYAATAVLVNILLQITAFISFLTLDSRRRENNRLDWLPCVIAVSDDEPYTSIIESSESAEDSMPLLEYLFQQYYAPFILHKHVKPVIVVLFLTLFVFLGILPMQNIELGLDQRIALPKDSYLIPYFDVMQNNLEVGPPLYFVVLAPSEQPGGSGPVDFTSIDGAKLLCGKFLDCDKNSISRVLDREYRRNNIPNLAQGTSTIVTPSSVWLDDFVTYLNSANGPCCIKTPLKDCFQDPPDTEEEMEEIIEAPDDLSVFRSECACWQWRELVPRPDLNMEPTFNNFLKPTAGDKGGFPSNRTEFMQYLNIWLEQRPTSRCPFAGAAAHKHSILMDPSSPESNNQGGVRAFYIRTYHRVLRTQQDFIDAYKDALRIANLLVEESFRLPSSARITVDERSYPLVFPYSIFYVFFEQYLSIVQLASTLILAALLAIFIMVTLLIGSPLTALLVVLVVGMMVVEMVGVMALWGISLNAVTTVNLVIAVGIGVEFCVHVARGVVCGHTSTTSKDASHSEQPSPAHVQKNATERSLVELGSSVFSGITLTKLIGITVLAFAHSTIFELFYFRMYLCMVLLGVWHGLMVLPVLLSLCRVGEWGKSTKWCGPEGGWLWAYLRGRRGHND